MQNFDTEGTYSGRNINEMAPYAKLMGQANDRNTPRLQRIEIWWSDHPMMVRVVGLLAGAVMVGIALHHMYTFN